MYIYSLAVNLWEQQNMQKFLKVHEQLAALGAYRYSRLYWITYQVTSQSLRSSN